MLPAIASLSLRRQCFTGTILLNSFHIIVVVSCLIDGTHIDASYRQVLPHPFLTIPKKWQWFLLSPSVEFSNIMHVYLNIFVWKASLVRDLQYESKDSAMILIGLIKHSSAHEEMPMLCADFLQVSCKFAFLCSFLLAICFIPINMYSLHRTSQWHCSLWAV